VPQTSRLATRGTKKSCHKKAQKAQSIEINNGGVEIPQEEVSASLEENVFVLFVPFCG
jgi:hypothetical protein